MTSYQRNDLDYLIEQSKKIKMTPDQVVAQRRSFAYGNTAFENEAITKKMIEEEADRLGL